MSRSTANQELVSDFLDAFSAGNTDAVLGYLDDAATWWTSGSLEGLSGTKDKVTMGQVLAGIRALTTDGGIRITPLAWTVQGGRVAVEAESFAELKNGREYRNLYHFLFEVADQKIRTVKEYTDTELARTVLLSP